MKELLRETIEKVRYYTDSFEIIIKESSLTAFKRKVMKIKNKEKSDLMMYDFVQKKMKPLKPMVTGEEYINSRVGLFNELFQS